MRSAQGRLNLRRRVGFALVAIVALFVTIQGVLAYLSLEEQEDDLVDELVLAEAKRLAARPGEIDLQSLGPNFSAWLVDAGGRAVPGPLPAQLAALSDGQHLVRPGQAELHVVVLSTPAGRLFVQYDAKLNEAKVHQFGMYLLGLGALCILLGVAVALRIAAIVVAPIERVTGLLNQWVPGAKRSGAGASDEESELLDAFSRVQERFEKAIAREREFIANLQHEIRTPLSAARTDLEMLALAETPGSPPHERLQRALASLDALSAQVEAARALWQSRRIDSRPMDLAQCVEDAWASLGAMPQSRGLRFSNEVPRQTVVTADRHALLTILRNLMRNAAEHAAPARCIVRLAGHGVEVIDDGPGIPPQDLPHVFERYYRGRRSDAPGAASDERGLGLAIARQLAESNGWKLSAAPAEGRGAKFILAFE
jgi:signal transduction histidine kinase